MVAVRLGIRLKRLWRLFPDRTLKASEKGSHKGCPYISWYDVLDASFCSEACGEGEGLPRTYCPSVKQEVMSGQVSCKIYLYALY